jgi:antitoxin HigA-1
MDIGAPKPYLKVLGSPIEAIKRFVFRLRGLSLMKMYNPPHPGEIVADIYLKPFGLSARAIAKDLKVDPSTFSRLVSGNSSVSPDMAIRLSRVLGGSPESWLQMQLNYDLWQARHKNDHADLRPREFVAA